jgi:transposase
MKKKILKQVLGIDVAQKELVVRLGRVYEDLSTQLYAGKTFANNAKGFQLLIKWTQKLIDAGVPVRFVMEATGVYHESLAYFLEGQGLQVSIVLPNKISNYIRTLNAKTITDSSCADAICRFGLERELDIWQRPKPIFKRLRQLTRERDQVITSRTVAKNQLHAEQSEFEPNKGSVERIKAQIKLLTKQLQQIRDQITEMIQKEPSVKEILDLITSIPGIGVLTAVTILGETNGFELIRNKKQLVSYAGLDVKEKQSGTSVKGKAHISKRGNRYLRKSLYLPALSAIRSHQRFKDIFARLVSRHGIKMKAGVAIQRKLLEIVYAVYKTKTKYDPDFLKSNAQAEKNQLQSV